MIARERRRYAEPDEDHAADVALEAEIGAALLQPVAGSARGERVAAVADEAERRKQQAEENDLRGHVAAVDLHELRQEGQEEQRGLRVEQVDDEAVAKELPIAIPVRQRFLFAVLG